MAIRFARYLGWVGIGILVLELTCARSGAAPMFWTEPPAGVVVSANRRSSDLGASVNGTRMGVPWRRADATAGPPTPRQRQPHGTVGVGGYAAYSHFSAKSSCPRCRALSHEDEHAPGSAGGQGRRPDWEAIYLTFDRARPPEMADADDLFSRARPTVRATEDIFCRARPPLATDLHDRHSEEPQRLVPSHQGMDTSDDVFALARPASREDLFALARPGSASLDPFAAARPPAATQRIDLSE